jgi:outer membrane protein assembly factor BamB
MSKRWLALLALSVAFITTATSALNADDWPQWAGPKRDGIWRETGILEKFPADGPKVLWRIPIGAGYSGPAVVGERLYITDRPDVPPPPAGQEARISKEAIPGVERVLCLDTKTGKQIWEHKYDCPYQISYPSGPRTTPTVVNGKVYTLGAMGHLLCLDANDGKVIWSRDYRKDFELKKPPVWGWSSSPVVDGDRIYSLVGGDGTTVVCFDAKDGKEIWRALSSEEIGYSPPFMADIGGKKQLIVWHTEQIVGLDPATGKTIWSLDYPIEGERQRPEVSIAAPLLIGDRLLLSNFYHGATLIKVLAGEGKPEVIWNIKSPNLMKPSLGLHTVMCTPVLNDKHVYGICGHGELRCLELDSGKRVWESLDAVNKKRGLFAHAFIIPQGNHYWIYNDQGDLLLTKLTPAGYEEIGRVHLLDTTLTTRGRDVTWCHPAFANKCMFVRNDKEIVCVSLAAS